MIVWAGMPRSDERRIRENAAQVARIKRVRLSAENAKSFQNLPAFFGMPLISRIVVALAISGPARLTDLMETASRNPTPLFKALNALGRMGVVATVSLGTRKGEAYFLNREYPAYDAIVEFGVRISTEYATPRWKSIAMDATRQWVALPANPECKLFGVGHGTAVLLLLYEFRGATPGQIRKALGLGRASTKRMYATLVEMGMVAALSDGQDRDGAYVLDPRFRYASELRAVLRAMVTLYPQYTGLAQVIPEIERPRFPKPEPRKKRAGST